MARVSQKTIDLIKDSADIVDVVSEFVPLQVAGKNMKGLCPFHSEKTPSFFVSKERQIFNCFGCGEKGNSITFIQKYKNISFVEALQYLADKYNIDLELDNNIKQVRTGTNLYKANEKALKYFSLNLLNLEKGKRALDYLLNRGLDISTIEEFNLGFSSNQKNGLLTQLKNEYQPLDLLNAGLINKTTNGEYYDLFRNRIMFPIKDDSNRAIAFSGRIFGDSTNTAKYVNTPYTELFSKGMVLYNIAKALPFIKTNNRIVLMEGYMDVIKASMFNVKEAVCSMGTQLTIDQALKIKNYTDNVVICFDGDRAGREATFKALKLFERAQLNIKIVLMPQGIDPDEYMNKHTDFKYYLDNNQIDQYDFIYKMILENKNLSKPAEIEAAKNQMFDFFSTTSGMIREIYFNKFASDALVSYEIILTDYQKYLIDNRILMNYQKIANRQKEMKVLKPRYKAAAKTILSYYLYDISYRDIVNDKYNQILIEDTDINLFLSTARLLNLNQSNKAALLVLKSDLAEDYKKKLDELLLREDYIYNMDDFESCIKILQVAKLEEEIEDLEDESKALLNQTNDLGYLNKAQEIKVKKAKIMELLGRKNNGQKTNH